MRFLHPLHNFSIVSYDPRQLSEEVRVPACLLIDGVMECLLVRWAGWWGACLLDGRGRGAVVRTMGSGRAAEPACPAYEVQQ